MAFIFFLFFRGGMKRGVCGVGVATTATKEQLQRQQHNTQLKQQQQHPSLSTVQKCISGGGASLSATTEGPALCVCVLYYNLWSNFSFKLQVSLLSFCVCAAAYDRTTFRRRGRESEGVCVCTRRRRIRQTTRTKHREIAADNDYKSYRAYTCKS